MKINYIELNNIGPYVGVHKFDLNTNPNKNIILIGGKNGAGKTTFLKAMKYGLFGCFALGLKTITEQYLNEIKTILNNSIDDNFYIKIKFEYIEDLMPISYVFTRKWNIKNETIIETLKIASDDRDIGIIEANEISEKIRAITSPELINSYIFDGEKIGNKIENGDTALYLEDTFNSIFNINLIEQTKKDLTKQLEKIADETKSLEVIENITTIKKIDSLKSDIKLIEKNLSDAKDEQLKLIYLKKDNMNKFYELGGISEKQQKVIKEKIDSTTKVQDEMSKEIKSFLETDFPIYIVRNLLDEALSEIDKEKAYKLYFYISELENTLDESLDYLRESVSSYISSFIGDENGDFEPFQKIYDSDYVDNLKSREKSILMRIQRIKKFLNGKSADTNVYRLLKNKISKNDNTEETSNILLKCEKIDNEINSINNLITTQTHLLKNKNTELGTLYAYYEKISDTLKKSVIVNSSYDLINLCIKVCDEHIAKIKSNKLREISEYALDIFNDTIRKNGFLSNIVIDDKFNLHLFNMNKAEISVKTLSAGEMQILISSLIWAMFKSSNRREMFVFDTPLARLDKENRKNFIDKIISTISSQVVILSTDSEIVNENLDIIKDKVYKEYLLNYNTADGTTSVKEGYF